MSGLVMGLVLKHSRSRGISRLVAVVIGDCCEDDGTGAWPAIRTIAKRAGTSERTAQRSLTNLERLGELAIIANAGPRRSNLYEIIIDRLLANSDGDKSSLSDRVKSARVTNRQGDKSTRAPKLHPVRESPEGCQDEPADGDRIEPEGDKAMAPDPSSGSVLSDPSKDPPSGAAGSKFKYSDDFEEFWRIYPNRNGKRKAFEAWRKLTSGEKATAEADVPRRLTMNWSGRETEKIPHASTYLNQHQWEDDLAANRIVAVTTPRLSPGMETIRAIGKKWSQEDGARRDAAAGGQSQGQLVPPANR
jgi:hypothetical protein